MDVTVNCGIVMSDLSVARADMVQSSAGGSPLPADLRRRRRQTVLFGLLQYAVVVGVVVWAVWRGAAAMQYTWHWDRALRFIAKETPDGLKVGSLTLGLLETLRISLVAGAVALALGFALALARLSSSWSLTRLAAAVVEIIRNTPLIVQISMFYFVFAPVLGISRFWTGVLSLALFEGAFLSEIIRSGILAVPRGQWEAGMSLGLGRRRITRLVILPQALRIMLAPLTSAAISLVKNSSIVSVIALFELTTAGRDAISETYLSFEIWLTVAAIYLALTFALSRFAAAAERRFARPFNA
jgi:polar amino acid transport system permease protein